jgi:hypothetical protein
MENSAFILIIGMLQIIFLVIQSSGPETSKPEFETDEVCRAILKSHIYGTKL